MMRCSIDCRCGLIAKAASKLRKRGRRLVDRVVDQAEAGQRAEMARLEIERALDVEHRGAEVAHQIVQGGALVPALGEVGRLLDHPIEALEGDRGTGLRHRQHALLQQQVDLRVARLAPDPPDALLDRLGLAVARGALQPREQAVEPTVALVRLRPWPGAPRPGPAPRAPPPHATSEASVPAAARLPPAAIYAPSRGRRQSHAATAVRARRRSAAPAARRQGRAAALHARRHPASRRSLASSTAARSSIASSTAVEPRIGDARAQPVDQPGEPPQGAFRDPALDHAELQLAQLVQQAVAVAGRAPALRRRVLDLLHREHAAQRRERRGRRECRRSPRRARRRARRTRRLAPSPAPFETLRR